MIHLQCKLGTKWGQVCCSKTIIFAKIAAWRRFCQSTNLWRLPYVVATGKLKYNPIILTLNQLPHISLLNHSNINHLLKFPSGDKIGVRK